MEGVRDLKQGVIFMFFVVYVFGVKGLVGFEDFKFMFKFFISYIVKIDQNKCCVGCR